MTDVIITQNPQQVVLVTQESYNVIENLAVGPQGMNAYQVAVSNGFVGTVQDWLDSLVGPKGADGQNGIDGSNGTNGVDGLSAYQVAISQGFIGTEQQWLDSLKGETGVQGPQGLKGDTGETGPAGPQGLQGEAGPQGPAGPSGSNGLSAYEIAVINGFVGTQMEWLDSLEGATGPQGVPGIQGPVGPQGPAGEDVFVESSPIFTYTDGLVTRVDYSSGNYKIFTYSSGVLVQLDYIRTTDPTIRKVFTYNPDGSLASISESIL